jgi:hypothetical protein
MHSPGAFSDDEFQSHATIDSSRYLPVWIPTSMILEGEVYSILQISSKSNVFSRTPSSQPDEESAFPPNLFVILLRQKLGWQLRRYQGVL